ncbi:MAG TPA: glycosyl transferase [Planctomycetaceae bacterium]|nr:glycosyl transferase [Blastopirellula sp.]HAY79429.1 glycosyl transferase [Planctomycetaceae bacterium]|tara:strand:+ start:120 stop:953 length:834 start_codon:yes stop_codon:yes gene_type:complete
MNDHSSIPATELQPYTAEWYSRIRDGIGEIACKELGIYVIPDSFCLSVVIPIYNEFNTLLDLVNQVKSVPIRKELILVDDGSTDGTRDLLDDVEQMADAMNSFQVILHDQNQGKGSAVRTGFAHVTGNVVIIQDADLEYDPKEYPRLIRPLIEQKADVVYGSRFLGDYPHRVLYFWHYLGNRFLTTLSNCFTNLNLTDMETCYKVFTRETIEEILPKLRQNRFGIEPEITAKIARRRKRIYEMSISYSGRSYDDGKKIGWRDGISALWCILRYGLAD